MKAEILKTLQDKMITDAEFMSEEEKLNLSKQIDFVLDEIRKEKRSKYLRQLREFKHHMQACFEVLMDTGATDETIDIFYNSPFEITFRGQTVELANGAEVYNAIEELIQTEIDNEEEI